MVCLACGELAPDRLCDGCARTVRAAPDAWVGGMVVRAAFVHERAAKALVHRLKYEGIRQVADLVAADLECALPQGARALVPIPRALPRRLRYGIDPGRELAAAVGRRTGVPVVEVLRAELWHRPNAGKGRGARRVPRFGLTGAVPDGAVLIDDVLTTGTTLMSARRSIGPCVLGAVTITRAVVGQLPEPGSGVGKLPVHGFVDRSS